MSQSAVISELVSDDRVRTIEYDAKAYFSLIDVFSVLLNVDRKHAQNYYHVLKKRMLTTNINLPLIRQFKAQSYDKKLYLTDFTTIEGIQFFYNQSVTKIDRKKSRVEIREADEVINFHPKVIAYLQQDGWEIQHHVKLPSGCIIDLIAYSNDLKYIIECKPQLSKSIFYNAIGQVLCYCQEYNSQAQPAIASYRSNIDVYTFARCEELGITIIMI